MSHLLLHCCHTLNYCSQSGGTHQTCTLSSYSQDILWFFCVVLEENPNFVTLDEVGEEEEEKISLRARGRPRKRSRQTPGRPPCPNTQPHVCSSKVVLCFILNFLFMQWKWDDLSEVRTWPQKMKKKKKQPPFNLPLLRRTTNLRCQLTAGGRRRRWKLPRPSSSLGTGHWRDVWREKGAGRTLKVRRTNLRCWVETL